VDTCLAAGDVTGDLGGTLIMTQVTQKVIAAL
jgi:hypothetical protein